MDLREPLTSVPPRAVTNPVMRMRWEELTYLHWALDPDVVAARLPGGLVPDLYEGRAYVGLVPFRMASIGVGRRGPRLPFGRFPETNVRTYVIGPDGGRGVYFHSLDIDRLAPVLVARGAYRLPYAASRMRLGRRAQQVAYLTRRRWPAPHGAVSRVVVEVGDPVDPETALDRFLSARWSLYATLPGAGLLRADVSHPAWQLRAAHLHVLDDELVEAAGYPADLGTPSHVRFGGDVEVLVSAPRRVA